ncbi:MAG TPA: nitronate monooxygenase [Nocardioidaceae bacterium]|nr:nitronate monooxygenase [Nocardioidaceae bacterium]
MIETRLTRALGVRHPIVSAPMALAGGGALAAAVSRAGGLGLIGGGYGDATWLGQQFDAAHGERVGVGFITWSLKNSPALLDDALERRPAAVMLSFGDPREFVESIRASGTPLICQCQNLGHVQDAVDSGAAVVVAQGAEAGGHGSSRGTLSFVPEAADFLARRSPETLLLAAGGIADGRGLAAALMLGADGVLIGTRFWASTEALVHPRHHPTIIAANGDDTIRTRTPDIARDLPWPPEFTARVRQNEFTARWHGHEDELAQSSATEGPRYRDAWAQGDPENAGVWFGEAAGLIESIEPAGAIVERIMEQATQLLTSAPGSS